MERVERMEIEKLIVGTLGPFSPSVPERMAGPTRLAVWIEDETGEVFVVGAAKGRRVDLIEAVT